ATKIDQIVASEHEAVRQLLGVLVKKAYTQTQQAGAAPAIEAVAAVRASVEQEYAGQAGIVGLGQAGKPVGFIRPSVPAQWPSPAHWQAFGQWQPPLLLPPKGLDYRNHDALPHIRMDSLINSLLGDFCP
ncbi:MAG TPA: YcjX family protein, partial [Cellvibrionaceae bacterium]|nr:YcjX family protein [Cellvibrionaceae bacterium]